MIVVDASVMAPLVADSGPDGDRCRAAVRGHLVAAPDLLHVEVTSVLRRQVSNGKVTARQAERALDDLLAFPLVRYPTSPLLHRCWAMRANLTAYDACYVALAEALDAPLLTADKRLAASPGARCTFQLV